MAFTSTILSRTVFGNKVVSYGTYTSTGGSTGGNIDTGINVVEMMLLTPKGTSVGTNESVVNETYPVAGSAVTIVTDSNQAGYWFAIGTSA